MIFDLHNDILTCGDYGSFGGNLSKRDRRQYSKNIVYAVWTTRIDKPARFLTEVARLGLACTAIEDLHFLSRSNVSVLDDLKPLYASLTWNGENLLAGGADTDCGVTAHGKWAICQLLMRGIALDTAHLCRRSFFQAVELAAASAGGRVICSHTCFDGVFCHPRNLTDLQIRTIIDCGGIIGLCLVPAFMGKTRGSAQDVVRQIDYFAQKFGCRNLAIGSDFFGIANPALKDYRGFTAVKHKLLKIGYGANDIDSIFYRNAMEFFKKDIDEI